MGLLKEKKDLDDDETQKENEETTKKTKDALEKIVNVRLSAAQPKNVPKQSSDDAKFIKYKPSQQSGAFNSGAKERIIRVVEMPVDALEPPKFKHKRLPKAKASRSPPLRVMHSPPRPVTVKDQQDWKILPCISNWKNRKGHTIPLDVEINDNFAKLSEALYVAEQKAREAVAMRSKVHKEMLLKEKELKEQQLSALAHKARSERKRSMEDTDVRGDSYEHSREREKKLQRERIREERRRGRERERDAAILMGKRSKITRDRDGDIKVALGIIASTESGAQVMHDERLFNQDKGISCDDQYNDDVYESGLFTAQPTLYRPKKDKGFAGASERDRPVEFENEEADPFGLDHFLTHVNKGKKSHG